MPDRGGTSEISSLFYILTQKKARKIWKMQSNGRNRTEEATAVDKLEFNEQLALLTITNYKLQITNGYITEGVF
jgi:hypothetical protein